MSTEQDITEILERIQLHLPNWSMLVRKADDLKVQRLTGHSNACFKVEISPDLIEQNPGFEGERIVLYRRFELQLNDSRIEHRIFKLLSDEGTGPKLLHSSDTFRFESFYPGRPVTVWEMRNPYVFCRVAEILCDYNFNQKARETVQAVNPMIVSKLHIHEVVNEWTPNMEAKIDSVINTLTSAEHHEHAQIISQIKSTFLFEGWN